jgi:hypothetical protein
MDQSPRNNELATMLPDLFWAVPISECHQSTAADSDGCTFPVSRETEPYKGIREQSSVMMFMKRFYANLNRWPAPFLASAELLAQKRENLLLN